MKTKNKRQKTKINDVKVNLPKGEKDGKDKQLPEVTNDDQTAVETVSAEKNSKAAEMIMLPEVTVSDKKAGSDDSTNLSGTDETHMPEQRSLSLRKIFESPSMKTNCCAEDKQFSTIIKDMVKENKRCLRGRDDGDSSKQALQSHIGIGLKGLNIVPSSEQSSMKIESKVMSSDTTEHTPHTINAENFLKMPASNLPALDQKWLSYEKADSNEKSNN